MSISAVTGNRKVGRVRVPETRPNLWIPAGFVKTSKVINIYYSMTFFISFNVLALLIMLVTNQC